MADGEVNPAQATVIAHALDALPTHLGHETITQAEETLTGYAEEFQPVELRRLGRRILEVVAPEIAEAEEAQRLEREEQHARDKATLSLKPLGDGLTRITGRLPDADATRLASYLEAYTSLRHDPAMIGGEGEKVPTPASSPTPSVPCSNTSTPTGSRLTAGMPPRCWSPSPWTR